VLSFSCLVLTRGARRSSAAASPCRTPSSPRFSLSRRPRSVRRPARHLPVSSAHETEPPSSILCRTAAAHRRSQPSAVAARALACVRSRRIEIRRSLTLCPTSTASRRRQPLDLDPTDQIESARVNTGQTGRTSPFCGKPPELFGFYKIPSRSSRFFAVRSFLGPESLGFFIV
jgi:hypothetical protein